MRIFRGLLCLLIFFTLVECSSVPEKRDSNWIGYTESGKASYYAMKFQSKKTASGELYDGAKKTAAHKKLPFGHLTPRKVAMTAKLSEILSRRVSDRTRNVPWVFWQRYRDRSTGKMVIGPFHYRRTILRTLCKKAGVRYFGFHALRHSGASLMDKNNVPISSIQRILGHENRQTTEIYLHSIEQAERDAVAVYERARQNSHTILT